MKIVLFFLISTSLFGISLESVLGDFQQKISKNRLSQRLAIPHSVVMDNDGYVYIVDTAANKIRKIIEDNKVITIIGNEGDSDNVLKENLKLPIDITFDNENNLIISDTYNNRIKKVTKDKKVITIAGTGIKGFDGDGIATEKKIFFPKDITFYNGEVYFIDAGNNLVRKIDKSGKLITVIGNGKKYFDEYFMGTYKDLKLNYPTAIAFDKSGKLYLADNNGTYIIKINLKTGKVIHFAGNGKMNIKKKIRFGWYPTETHIGTVNSIFIYKGIVYLVSSSHNTIIYIKKGRVESLVDYIGDKAHYKNDRTAYLPLNYPTDILVKKDEIYIADKRNNYIRKIKNEIISIFVGFWNNKKEIEKLYYPNSISVDNKFVYLADTLNYRVIQLDKKFKNPKVIAGTGIRGFFEEYDQHFAKDINIGFVNSISLCNNELYLLSDDRVWKIKNQILMPVIQNIDAIDLICHHNKLTILTKNSILSIDDKDKKELVEFSTMYPKKIASDDKTIYFTSLGKILKLDGTTITSICKSSVKDSIVGKQVECGKFNIKNPTAIAVDKKTGAIYFYDAEYSKIFAIKDNFVYHIAGNGKKGFDKFNGDAIDISLNDPQDFFIEKNRLYFVDSANNLVRVIDLNSISFKKVTKEIKEDKKKDEKKDEKVGCSYSQKKSSVFILFFIFILFVRRVELKKKASSKKNT